MNWKYTTILMDVKKQLELSFNEYATLDLIYHVSTYPQNPTLGWCSYKRSVIQDALGLSRKGLFKIITKLLERELLEKNHDDSLRTTDKWFNTLYKFGNFTQSGAKLEPIEGVPGTHQRGTRYSSKGYQVLIKMMKKTVLSQRKIRSYKKRKSAVIIIYI